MGFFVSLFRNGGIEKTFDIGIQRGYNKADLRRIIFSCLSFGIFNLEIFMGKLAILGGTPAVSEVDPKIFKWPIVTPEMESAGLKVFTTARCRERRRLGRVTNSSAVDYLLGLLYQALSLGALL